MEKIRGKYLFQVLDDELEKVALEWHGNNIDDNPNSQGVFRVSSIEIIFRKLLEEYLEQELDRAREEVIKNLIKKIEEANCDSISLELLREINLSKLTTK